MAQSRQSQFRREEHYRYLSYTRFSSDEQNPRSVEQQLELVEQELFKQNLSWTPAAHFCDPGGSGRIFSRRPGLMSLLDYVQRHSDEVDLVVVDTTERLGRADDVDFIRHILRRKGILLVAAQNGFSDPTTPEGELYQKLDMWRAKQENLIKGRAVSRGKADSVRLKLWPGGPPPTGYRLEVVAKEKRGSREVERVALVPDDVARVVPQKIFELADLQGWRGERIARALREDPSVPEPYRKLQVNTIDRILANPIYTGLMQWGKRNVDYVNDAREITLNPQDDWVVVENYCEPLVAADRFERVQKEKSSTALAGSSGRGVALKYALTGFVVCAECGRSMIVNSRRDRAGKVIVAPTYRCPATRLSDCNNRTGVPYEWLLPEVLTTLVEKLFGIEKRIGDPMTSEDVQKAPVFTEFYELVQQELQRLEQDEPVETGALQAERDRLQQQQEGWCQSLGTPTLPASLRLRLTEDYESAERRIREIDQLINRIASRRRVADTSTSPENVAAILTQLSSVLAGENLSAANVELSKHIDTIMVHADGTLKLRLCKLGILAEMSTPAPAFEAGTIATSGKTRRRPRRRVPEEPTVNPLDVGIRPDTGFDLTRFQHLGAEWFWEISFVAPRRVHWIDAHAIEAAQSRLAEPCSIDVLAARFGVSDTTIEKALKRAKEQGVDATQIDGRRLQSNWAEDHADEVLAFVEAHDGNKSEAARHFGKSAAWIRTAMKFAMEKGNRAGDGEADDLRGEAA